MGALLRWDPVRWDPVKEMEEIGERFNRVFGRLPSASLIQPRSPSDI